ncbi:hypothetical protein CDL12_23533 [Handroanthus impetiginosus]|uniref:Uncharacterized protein n=1 Tax=Handroanthus impetiginosus TaxID=429701 RepID=A0A2G9GF66_9LAMI|nr:hypothetical protein CDL12_23533 [Handroanthus impetiginosus]
MKAFNSASVVADPKRRSCLCSLFITMSLICGAYFTGTALLGKDSFGVYLSGRLGVNTTHKAKDSVKCEVPPTLDIEINDTKENTNAEQCNGKCRPIGGETLPEGIISITSNLEMQPLSGPVSDNNNSKHTSLLAVAVGIKQKTLVNQIVEKFLADGFVVMLFHYDGIVDEWHDLDWSHKVIHLSARNQTKWWFAKRFLHPDIVAEYDYIFLWDEDLGLENFHPKRYLSIIKEEGLEISQPALEASKSEVHHHITIRRRRSRVHRRYYRFRSGGSGRCDENSTAPPCVGWVEMMAPVFSKPAWRCVWYMIQNDLIHAWGLDKQLGYCAQGDRTVKVGVVDEDYIVHLGLPTLGAHSNKNETSSELSAQSLPSNSDSESSASSRLSNSENRYAVRLRSHAEMMEFRNRWKKAVKEDECWVDPF